MASLFRPPIALVAFELALQQERMPAACRREPHVVRLRNEPAPEEKMPAPCGRECHVIPLTQPRAAKINDASPGSLVASGPARFVADRSPRRLRPRGLSYYATGELCRCVNNATGSARTEANGP